MNMNFPNPEAAIAFWLYLGSALCAIVALALWLVKNPEQDQP